MVEYLRGLIVLQSAPEFACSRQRSSERKAERDPTRSQQMEGLEERKSDPRHRPDKSVRKTEKIMQICKTQYQIVKLGAQRGSIQHVKNFLRDDYFDFTNYCPVDIFAASDNTSTALRNILRGSR